MSTSAAGGRDKSKKPVTEEDIEGMVPENEVPMELRTKKPAEPAAAAATAAQAAATPPIIEKAREVTSETIESIIDVNQGRQEQEKEQEETEEDEDDEGEGEEDEQEEGGGEEEKPASSPAEKQQKQPQYVLQDPTDYAAVRHEKGLPDPFVLYGKGYRPTDIYQDVTDRNLKHIHLISGKKDVSGTPEDLYSFTIKQTISADEAVRLQEDAKRQNMFANKKEDKVALAVAFAKHLPSGAGAGGGKSKQLAAPEAAVAAAAAAAAATTTTMIPANVVALLEDEKISPALKESIRKEYGISKNMGDNLDKEGEAISDKILPFVKVEKGREFVAQLLSLNKGMLKAVADVGLQAILVSFQLARMNPDEMSETIVSFDKPDDLINFVTEKLTDAYSAATEPHQEKFERAQEEAAAWLKRSKELEAQLRLIEFDKLQAEFNSNIALSCFETDRQTSQYYTLIDLARSPHGRERVERFIVDKRMALITSSSSGSSPSTSAPSTAAPNGHAAVGGGGVGSGKRLNASNIPLNSQGQYDQTARCEEFGRALNNLIHNDFADLDPKAWGAYLEELKRK